MISDISWDAFAQYAGLGVVLGISLGSFCIGWAFFISRVRTSIQAACRVGDL